MLRVAAFMLLVLGVAVGAQDNPQADPQSETDDLLNEGVILYRQGHLDKAYEAFEKAIQKKPNSDKVYAWLKRTGEDIIYGMINEPDRKLQDLGRRLLNLARASENFGVDAQKIKDMLNHLKPQEPFDVQRIAHYHLVVYGPYAAQYLVPILNDPAQDVLRARVMLVLKEIGTPITLAVCEALESERENFKMMRQNACVVLGNIGDERAVPALKRCYEDANEYPEVKREAHIALAKLTNKKDDKDWKKATEYYYELAQKYYYTHPDVIRSWERSFKYWKWDEQNQVLTQRRVPQYAYNEQLCEEALYDLLELDSDFAGAWSLLAMAFSAQVIEAEAAIKASEEAKALEELSEEDLADLKERMTMVERCNVLNEMIAPQYTYEAIERTMKDGSPLVCQHLIDIIKKKGKVEDLPPPVETAVEKPEGEEEKKEDGMPRQRAKETYIGYPLVDALAYFDKRVRYTAAEAMLVVAPRDKRLGWELVIPNLSDALGESGVRVALIIYDVRTEEDHAIMNRMKKTFEKINVFPMFARSAGEGLIKARDFPTEDVIFIQNKVASQLYVREEVGGKKLVEESVFDTLRDDVRTRNIPKYIIADNDEEAKKAEEIYKSHIQYVVMNDADHLLLERHLNETLEFERAKKDAKSRADEMARRAAEALRDADSDTVCYPMADAVPALIKACSPEVRREKFIRVPAVTALGHIGDTRAVDVGVKIVNDKPEDEEAIKFESEVRFQAAKALSRIFWRNKYTPSEEIVETLRKWLDDGEYRIEEAVGEAFGNANLVNQRRTVLENLKRNSSFRGRLGKTVEDIEKDGKD